MYFVDLVCVNLFVNIVQHHYKRNGKLSFGAQEVSDFYCYQYGEINAEEDCFY